MLRRFTCEPMYALFLMYSSARTSPMLHVLPRVAHLPHVAQVERLQPHARLVRAADPHELVNACVQAALEEAVQRMVGEAHHQDGAHVRGAVEEWGSVERTLCRLGEPCGEGRAGRRWKVESQGERSMPSLGREEGRGEGLAGPGAEFSAMVENLKRGLRLKRGLQLLQLLLSPAATVLPCPCSPLPPRSLLPCYCSPLKQLFSLCTSPAWMLRVLASSTSISFTPRKVLPAQTGGAVREQAAQHLYDVPPPPRGPI